MTNNKSNKYLFYTIRHGSLTYLFTIVGFFIGMLNQAVAARSLGASELGMFRIIVSITSILALFVVHGADRGLERFMPVCLQKQRFNEIKGMLLTRLKHVILFGALASVALLLASGSIAKYVYKNSSLESALYHALFLSFLMSISVVMSGALRGLTLVAQSSFINFFLAKFLRTGTLVVLLLFMSCRSVLVLIYSVYLADIVVLGCMAYLCWRTAWLPDSGGDNSILTHEKDGEISSYSLKLFSVTLVTSCIGLTDSLILGVFGTLQEVGVYGIIVALSQIILFFGLATGSAAMPMFSSLFDVGDMMEVRKLYKAICRLLIIFVFPVAVTFHFFSAEIMGIFGKDFVIGSSSFRILSACYFLSCFSGISRPVLAACGGEGLLAKDYMGFFIVSNILFFALIPSMGITGCCLAVGISMVALSLAQHIQVKKVIGCFAWDRSWLRVLSILPGCIVIAMVFANFASADLFIRPIGCGVSTCIMSFLAYYFLFPNDRSLIKTVLPLAR